MKRRSFLGALLAAPVVAPSVVKAASSPSIVGEAAPEPFWSMRLEGNGYVGGLQMMNGDDPPLFSIETVNGVTTMRIRADVLHIAATDALPVSPYRVEYLPQKDAVYRPCMHL